MPLIFRVEFSLVNHFFALDFHVLPVTKMSDFWRLKIFEGRSEAQILPIDSDWLLKGVSHLGTFYYYVDSFEKSFFFYLFVLILFLIIDRFVLLEVLRRLCYKRMCPQLIKRKPLLRIGHQKPLQQVQALFWNSRFPREFHLTDLRIRGNRRGTKRASSFEWVRPEHHLVEDDCHWPHVSSFVVSVPWRAELFY